MDTNSSSDTLIDKVAQSADSTINSTQRVAEAGRNKLSDLSDHLRSSALHASDSTVKYVQHDPIKAILIAAATGAALMALLGLLGRSLSRK